MVGRRNQNGVDVFLLEKLAQVGEGLCRTARPFASFVGERLVDIAGGDEFRPGRLPHLASDIPSTPSAADQPDVDAVIRTEHAHGGGGSEKEGSTLHGFLCYTVNMKRTLMAAAVACLALCAQQAEQEKRAPEAKTTSITGCVDQRGERYVLSGMRQMKTIAVLRGKGFSDDNFARYVGHTITVEAEQQREGDTTVLLVSKIEDGGVGCSQP